MTSLPSLPRVLRVWLRIGLQSFGGGTSTYALIFREVAERERWLTPAEVAHANGLCQLAPGINLLALTILIGSRVAGAAGAVVALAGLLLPSVAVTVAMTAVYVRLEHIGVVRPALAAALRGIVPVLVGVGLVTAFSLASPLVLQARRQGRAHLAACAVILLGSGAAFALLHPPVLVILLGGGVAGAVAYVAAPPKNGAPDERDAATVPTGVREPSA